MFLFKKLAGAFLMPYSLGVVLLLAGVAVLWVRRQPGVGRALVTAAALLLTAAGCEPVAKAFMGSLENDFPPLADAAFLGETRWIVVLGGGHTADPTLPPSARLTSSALARLVEGIRLHRQLPGSRLLFSGFGEPVSHARVMADAAAALGVDPALVALEERPRDTDDEARLITERLAGEPFVLVTSAVHMPRAAALFRRAGADFVPAPAEYASRSGPTGYPAFVFPGWRALSATERTVHEYLGMGWASLGGG